MSSVATAIAAPPLPGVRHEFRFVANRRPIVQGTLAALVMIAAFVAWQGANGRLRDGTYAAVILGSVAVAVTWVVARIWRNARTAAAALGHIDLDDGGLRWIRGDGSAGFDAQWAELEQGTIDARSGLMVLHRKNSAPLLLGVLSQHGVPSGFVVIDRFDALTELVGQRVAIAPHPGTPGSPSARRTLLLGVATCAAAAAVFALNLLAGRLLHWERWQLPVPSFMACVGLIGIAAGLRLRAGRGPAVSPLYGPAYQTAVLRFLVVATLANCVLLAMANGLAR